MQLTGERGRHEERRQVARDQARSVRQEDKLDGAENAGAELGNVVQRIIVRKPYLKSEVVRPGEGAKRERSWACEEAGEGWSVGRLRRAAAVIQQVSNDLKWQQKKWHSWEVSGCTWMWDPGLAGLVEMRRKGTELHEKRQNKNKISLFTTSGELIIWRSLDGRAGLFVQQLIALMISRWPEGEERRWFQLHSNGVEEKSCLLNPHLAANSLVKASYDREKPFTFTLKNNKGQMKLFKHENVHWKTNQTVIMIWGLCEIH